MGYNIGKATKGDIMERQIMDELVRWKRKKNRKPLILKGARQVGKTWIMKEFGARQFKNVAYVNFDRNSRMQRVFEADFDIRSIIQAINIETKEVIRPEDTLIIFDEIQEVPRAISSLKYFCEEAPEYAIVAAGSLLGVAIHEGTSFPVGKVETLDIYPMNYREFLTAMGEEQLASLLGQKDYKMIDVFSEKYIRWLKLYYYIGGMPEAVASYVDEGDIVEVRSIQKAILEMYEDDFSKHTDRDMLPRIRMVWNSVPVQLAKENRKFFFGQIKEGARARDFETAIEWLLDLSLIHISEPTRPY